MKDRIKYYDKNILSHENNIELTIIIICVFLMRIYSRMYMYE